MLVKIRERYRGTRGSSYYYVLEGNKLCHISSYSKSSYKEDDEVFWYANTNDLMNKPIIEFSFSRNGYGYVSEYGIEDFGNDGWPDYKKRKWGMLLEKAVKSRFKDCTFETNSQELSKLIEDFKGVYTPMVNDINAYASNLGFKISFIGHAARINEAFDDPLTLLFACLSIPNDKSRLRSLNNVCKWVYQLWVLKLVCEALRTTDIKKRDWQEKPSWWIEQGSPYPTCIVDTPKGYYTCWFEFQRFKAAHVFALSEDPDPTIHKRVKGGHVRPDIVVVKGIYENAKDIKQIDLMIECKHEEFVFWEVDMYKQLPSYIEEFRPKRFVLTSLKTIPNHAKDMLTKKGLIVTDNLSIKNLENIDLFKKYISSI